STTARPWSEFTVQAECGSLGMRGRPEREPLQAGGRVAEWGAGTFGAVAALAAVIGARRSGRGEHVDVSLLEAMTVATNLFSDLLYSLLGIDAPGALGPARMVETPSIEPAADGWVGFNTNGRQQFDDFLVLIERADLLGDEELAGLAGRIGRGAEWDAIVHGWTRKHPVAEIVEQAALLRVPVAPVYNGRTLLDDEHLASRSFYGHEPKGRFVQPRPPYLLDGERPPPPRPA